jgi:protein TonB
MTSRRIVAPLAIGLSIALHAALVAGARNVPHDARRHAPPLLITIDVAPPPAAPSPPAEPPSRDAMPPPPRTADPRPPPVAEKPEPPPESPGGVGLAVDDAHGESWLAPVSDTVHFVERPPEVERPRAARPRQPAVVPPSNLSERLRPPALDSELQRSYPADARQRGIGGSAVVRARIGPDGTARSLQVLSESFPGFGAACQKTLTGSRWSVPRDRNGHAVTTEIRYTCRFVVSAR